MKQASDHEVAQLHSLLCGVFRKILQDGQIKLTKDGDVVTVTPDAALLKEIRQFLLDNDVKAIPAKGTPLGDLVGDLPFESDGDPYSLQ